jgi:hypothetical protein
LSLTDVDLETLLPGHQNPTEQIALALCDLGGRYTGTYIRSNSARPGPWQT